MSCSELHRKRALVESGQPCLVWVSLPASASLCRLDAGLPSRAKCGRHMLAADLTRHATIIPFRTDPLSSELGSQPELGCISTGERDHLGTRSVVVFCRLGRSCTALGKPAAGTMGSPDGRQARRSRNEPRSELPRKLLTVAASFLHVSTCACRAFACAAKKPISNSKRCAGKRPFSAVQNGGQVFEMGGVTDSRVRSAAGVYVGNSCYSSS